LKKLESTNLTKGILEGDILSVARLISLVENRDAKAREAMKEICRHSGRAHIIGITGVPGAGKSTLTGKLTSVYREQNKTVGIIAIDPTSPFTGGALLGDRIRMQDLAGDSGVFIRSMGTRGASGGLAQATSDVINILDAFKKDIIIVETIGIGQDEIEIEKYAHTLIVVSMPGGGDAIQCIKAGILEIGDIHVINKADHVEVLRAQADLEFMLELKKLKNSNVWEVPIIMTVAIENKGIDKLHQKIEEHRQYLIESGEIHRRRAQRSRAELMEIINRQVKDAVNEAIGEGGVKHDLVEKMAETGEIDPYTAAEMVIEHLLKRGRDL
jgi:LAO/AO transport system kinase